MKTDVKAAHQRIESHIRRTECRPAAGLAAAVGGEVFLKLESTQETGSFKLRGVVNKVLSLSDEESTRLLVAASTGNHGAAFAHALGVFDLRGKLFMPVNTAPVKVEKMRSTGVPFELTGEECLDAEAAAIDFARAGDHVWISPYNDPAVVHGQGTIGVELMDQLDSIDAVLVPVGGGGLISGVAGYLKSVDPSIQVIGCQPVNSCVMYESIKAGQILDLESLPTISDGTAGGIEKGSVTFDLCKRYVDDFILLEEKEIAAAMQFLYQEEGVTVEGAAALPAAAVMQQKTRFAGRRIVLIVSGGRVDETMLTTVLGADGNTDHMEKA